ncbi:MAG: amidohydrolase [Fibrobacteres bacterium]|nr:amidohydrolase [Fibrobacterota bacterium]
MSAYIISLILLLFISLSAEKNSLPVYHIEKNRTVYEKMAYEIWSNPEPGYMETKSAGLLAAALKDAGFTVRSGVAGIPTAFVAEFGSGKPVIGLIAEYDALPGLSQDNVPYRKPLTKNSFGHGCGHNLFGVASAAAAIAVKEWLVNSRSNGTVRLYGTPAEEGGAGKVYMVRDGLFDDADAVLRWHPGTSNGASTVTHTGNISAKYRFSGKSSHAAIAPEKGRSALDGVEAMNMMVNLMREHISGDSRIHYVITNGGLAPNVVPDFAEVYYYFRHFDVSELRGLFERATNAANGAAIGTGTTVECEMISATYPSLPNETIARALYSNLIKIGGVKYDEIAKAFSDSIVGTFDSVKSDWIKQVEEIQPFATGRRTYGSTDVADVSWVTPSSGLSTACWVPGTGEHTWQAVAASGHRTGFLGMINAAKVLSLTTVDLISDKNLLKKVRTEFDEKRGKEFKYEPLIGSRKPPLDMNLAQ